MSELTIAALASDTNRPIEEVRAELERKIMESEKPRLRDSRWCARDGWPKSNVVLDEYPDNTRDV